MKTLQQFLQYREIKKDLANGLSDFEIAEKYNIVLNTWIYVIKKRVVELTTQQIEQIIKNPDNKTKKQVAPNIFGNPKTSSKGKWERDSKWVNKKINRNNEIGVPIALQNVFKTKEDYIKYLVDQYAQGKYK